MIANLQDKAKLFLHENASAILTATGVVGTVGTAVLTGRASFKAAAVIQERKLQNIQESEILDVEPDFSNKDAVLAVWPLYIPPVVLGGGTVAAVIFANRISARKAAALAAAYGLSEQYLEEYKAKALEKLGVNKEQKIRDEIAQDRVSEDKNSQVIILSSGDVLCYDMLTGRYFQSTVEKIKKAMAEIHSEIYNHMYVSLSTFFDALGLPPTTLTENIGWNNADIPEVTFSTTRTDDDRPCLVIDFTPTPKPDYASLYN